MIRPAEGPTSIRFTEEMKGHVSFGELDHGRGAGEGREGNTRLMFHLDIEVGDLDRFEADDRREAGAEGWVRCEALGGRLPVERGVFNLFVDDGPGRKRMLYRLFFRDGVGHPLTLTGFKLVRGRPGGHVWRDTSTLYVRVLRGHVVGEGDEPGSEVVASGILRLRPWDFARQLATFRAGAPSPGARVAAVGRFDALFLGQLWQVYGRAFVGVRDVLAGVRRRIGRWTRR